MPAIGAHHAGYRALSRPHLRQLLLPGGEYTSLRVEIGAGKGENWWCVLYPSLCLSASAADAESAFLAAGFTPEQIRLLQGGSPRPFRIRFRLIEWLTELFS